MPQSIAKLICFIIITFCIAACGNGDSPEDQVRRYVQTGEEAAEARDLGAIKDLIAETYNDNRRRSKRDLVAITARYFLANKNIHIFTRIGELVFPEPDRAQVKLYVAMAGQNISDLDALLNMQADLYRFDLTLARIDQEWQLTSADWRPAGPDDFF